MKALVLLLALGAAPVAQANPSWDRPAEPYRIVGNIYYVGTEGIGVYLITTPKGHIVIDGSTEKGAKVVEANIKKLGFKLNDVKYLLETHAHYDHVGGLARLKRDTGAMFIASAADKPALEGGQHVGDNINGPASFPPIKVDRVIGNEESVSIGDITLTAHLTPGHTPGCTSWTLPVKGGAAEKGHVAIFYGSMTPAGNVLVGNKAYPGIVADYRLSFERLKAIKADIFLVNHPEFAHMTKKHTRQKAGDADAFVNPNEFQAFLKKAEADFNAELKRQVNP